MFLTSSCVPSPREWAPPLLVLFYGSPHSGTARFVLYADGASIIGDPKSNDPEREYSLALLSSAGLTELIYAAKPAALKPLKDSYSITDRTDDISNELHAWPDGRHKSVRLYGDVKSHFLLPTSDGDRQRWAEERPKIPRPFLDTFAAIIRMRPTTSCPWFPDQIEVRLWPAERGTLVEWPIGWPGLVKARPIESGFYFLLPRSELKAARALGTNVVELEGRKWWIDLRIPLPKEELWMSHLAGRQ